MSILKKELLFSALRSRESYSINKPMMTKNNHFSINNKYVRNEILDKPKENTIINTLYSLYNKNYNTVNDMLKSTINNINYKQYNNIILKNDSGFILYDDSTIYITFKGSQNYLDLLNGLTAKDIKIYNFSEAKVHKGFGELFLDMRNDINLEIKNILDTNKINKILFAGHSKGGCLSTIASVYYSYKLKNINISNHTFGMPSIGDDMFFRLAKQYIYENFNMFNDKDIVPYISLNKNFKHIHTNLILYDDKFEINNDIRLKYSLVDILLYGIKERDNIIHNHSCDKYIKNLSI